MSEKDKTLRRAKVTGMGTLLSRVLGLVRDILSAAVFGTSGAMDAFVLAFTVPNLFRSLFGEGALSAAFIPVYTELREKESEEAGRRLLSGTFAWLALVLIVTVGLGVVASLGGRWLAEPGSKQHLFSTLLAIMLPYAVLVCLTALIIGALQAHDRFLVPALSPVVLNVVWIAALLIFAARAADKAAAAKVVALGIIVAGVLQLALQLVVARRIGVAPRPAFGRGGRGTRDVKRVALLMGPVVLGLAATRINVMVDRVIAEVCIPGDGALSSLYFGDRLMQFPLGVLGIALATAVFPALARRAAADDREGFADEMIHALRMAFFMGVAAMAAGIALRGPIVALLYRRGSFDPESARRTGAVLALYLCGLWAYCGIHVMTRAFYARQDTKTPVRIMARVVALDIALNLILVWPLRERGVALATAMCAAVNLSLLIRAMRRHFGELAPGRILGALALNGVAGLACGLAAWGALAGLRGLDLGGGIGPRCVRVFAPGAAGLAAFFVVSLILGMKEGRELVIAFLPRRLRGD